MLLHKSIPVPPPPFRRRRAAARLSGSFGRSLRVVLASLPCCGGPPPAVLARGVHFETVQLPVKRNQRQITPKPGYEFWDLNQNTNSKLTRETSFGEFWEPSSPV